MRAAVEADSRRNRARILAPEMRAGVRAALAAALAAMLGGCAAAPPMSCDAARDAYARAVVHDFPSELFAAQVRATCPRPEVKP